MIIFPLHLSDASVSTRVYRLIFTKLSANIEQLVGFISVQYIQIAMARSRDVEIFGALKHRVFILFAGIRQLLEASQNGWKTFIPDEHSTFFTKCCELWSSSF